MSEQDSNTGINTAPPIKYAPVQARPVSAPGVRPWLHPRATLCLPTLSRREAWLDLFLVALAGLVVPMGGQLIAAAFAGGIEALRPELADILVVQKWFDVLLVTALMAYLVLRHDIAPASFGWRLGQWGRQLLWTLGCLAGAYYWLLMTMLLIGAIVLFNQDWQDRLFERAEDMKEIMPIRDLTRTFLLLIPVAIHEEILFRGLLLPYLRRLTGAWWSAIAISTGVFAVLHFDQGLVGVFQIAGVGLVFAVFFVLSRSLIAVTLAHFVFNFMQFQLMRLFDEMSRWYG